MIKGAYIKTCVTHSNFSTHIFLKSGFVAERILYIIHDLPLTMVEKRQTATGQRKA
jgi:hypothetical protein